MTFITTTLTLILALSPTYAKIDKKPLVKPISKQKFEVSIKNFEKNINPLNELKTFSLSPSMDEGFFSGMKVERFQADCKLPLFGIQENDTIESVNGVSIRFPADLIEVGEQLQKAKAGNKIRISIYRNDKTLTNTYLLVE